MLSVLGSKKANEPQAILRLVVFADGPFNFNFIGEKFVKEGHQALNQQATGPGLKTLVVCRQSFQYQFWGAYKSIKY